MDNIESQLRKADDDIRKYYDNNPIAKANAERKRIEFEVSEKLKEMIMELYEVNADEAYCMMEIMNTVSEALRHTRAKGYCDGYNCATEEVEKGVTVR